jgi:hypothetical protein
MNNKQLAHYLHTVASELEHSQDTVADGVEIILRRKKATLNSPLSLTETLRFSWPATAVQQEQ